MVSRTPPPNDPSRPGVSSPEISVVVPVRNEAGNIAPLIAEIVAAMSGHGRYEIVYVDDGSTDATADQLAREAAARVELRVVRHRRPAGQSAAIDSGVMAARGATVVTIDGDGQNDPADIPNLLARFAEDGDPGRLLVTGLRARRRDTLVKRASSRIANGVRGALLGDRTPDTGCGLKVFRRQAYLEMPRFDHMHRFLPALMVRGGGRVVSIPVNHRPRAHGATNYGLLDRLGVGIVDLMGVLWLQRRRFHRDGTEGMEENGGNPPS